MSEIEWKSIKDFEGLYEVNNKGEVRSLRKNIILRPCTPSGYLQVMLYKDKKQYPKLVHRLVAEAFILNDDPKNKVQVNHKDENTKNNNVENLEWCTPLYNNNYGTAKERIREKRIGKNSHIWTEESREKLRNSLRKYFDERKKQGKKKMDEEVRKKISESLKKFNREHPNYYKGLVRKKKSL